MINLRNSLAAPLELIAMPLFTIADVSVTFGGRDIFSGVGATLDAGDRVGLVGPNGAGKTTLLRVIAGEARSASGQVALAGGIRLGYVPQIPHIAAGRTAREEVLSGIAHLAELEEQIERSAHDLTAATGDDVTTVIRRYDELTHRFEAEGGYRYRAEAEQILAGLRLPEGLWSRPAAGLSGGEKSRVALARVLLNRPDVLLLDEPTNHLDIAGITWLEGFLQRWPGSVVVVSHDRIFLDHVTTETWDLRQGRLTTYRGNYSAFVRQRDERDLAQRDQYQRQQERIAHEEELIRRYKAGQRAKWAQGRQKQLNNLERVDALIDDAKVQVRLAMATRTGKVTVALDNVAIAQPGDQSCILLRFPERVEVDRGARVAVVGANGAGKTTLLRTIMGENRPARGVVTLGANARAGYYRQGTEHLDGHLSVLQELLETRNLPLQAARDFLARFLFRGDRIEQPVSTLSGGERSRLALAKLAADDVNLLLLDEPTNHLDIASREALEAVRDAYQGTILFVTHDRALISNLATETWLISNESNVGDANVAVLDGGVIEMPEAPLRRQQQRTSPPNAARQRDADLKELTRRRREVERLEAEVGAAEGRLAMLTQEVHQASADHDAVRAGEAGTAYAEAERGLQTLIAAWEYAAQAIEMATSSPAVG